MKNVIIVTMIVLFTIINISTATITAPAMPSGPVSGNIGTSYGYYTQATDSSGLSLKYTYDWGDGTSSTSPFMLSGSKTKMFHKWLVAGVYGLRTKATNSAGLVSTWSSPLQVTISGSVTPPVNNPPATPSLPSGSASGISGISYSYSTKATDPDGNKVKYTFDWGDGTTSATALVASGTSASTSHIWTVASGMTKTFSVKAKATDEKGQESGWSSVLSVSITGPAAVNNPPRTPYIPYGDIGGRTIYPNTYKTKANDPDSDMVKITFDWGDGTTSTTGFVASGEWASASHQWSNVEPGTFKGFAVRAMATDVHGAKSVWSGPLLVSIGAPYVNHAPSDAVVSGPTKGESGKPLTFTFVADDPDGDMVRYHVGWSAGGETTAYYPAGQPAKVSHTYVLPDGVNEYTYRVTAMAADDNNKMSANYSNKLFVTITRGLSFLASSQISDLQVDVNETLYAQTEEAEFRDTQTNESESVDEQTEGANFTDLQTNELEYGNVSPSEA